SDQQLRAALGQKQMWALDLEASVEQRRCLDLTRRASQANGTRTPIELPFEAFGRSVVSRPMRTPFGGRSGRKVRISTFGGGFDGAGFLSCITADGNAEG